MEWNGMEGRTHPEWKTEEWIMEWMDKEWTEWVGPEGREGTEWI